MYIYNTLSDSETRTCGQKLSSELRGGDIVLLHGELGAGKTTLVKGIATGLGIEDEMTSPTFSLMNTHVILSGVEGSPGKGTNFVHIDTYRLENEQELIDIGIEDYLGEENTICVIEWPEKIPNLLKEKTTTNITIEHLAENKRLIKIKKAL